MGRELQKAKNRSGISKVKHKSKLTKSGHHKKIDVLGNAIIAENWDKKLTLTQNYQKLGLTSRLNAPTGGIDKRSAKQTKTADPLHITSTKVKTGETIQPGVARVERDPETGKILRVIQPDEDEDETIVVNGVRRRRDNPLNDPVEDVLAGGGDAGSVPVPSSANAIVSELERQADRESAAVQKRRPRQQSNREREWVERLVAAHGDNIQAMVRDRKLNPMQQSEGDIKRRIRVWKERQG